MTWFIASLLIFFAAAPGATQRVTQPEEQPRTPAGDVPVTIDDSPRSGDRRGPNLLNRVENELLALDAELEHLAQRADEEARPALRELRRKRMDVQEELEQVRAAAREDWRAMQPRLEKSLAELRESFGRFREKIRPRPAPAPEDPTP